MRKGGRQGERESKTMRKRGWRGREEVMRGGGDDRRR